MKDVKEELELKIIKIFANNAEEVNDLYDYDKLVTHTAQEMRQELLTLIEQSNLRDRIEATKELLGLYQAKTKEGEYMFDFEKLLPQQIKAWEAQLKELEGSE